MNTQDELFTTDGSVEILMWKTHMFKDTDPQAFTDPQTIKTALEVALRIGPAFDSPPGDYPLTFNGYRFVLSHKADTQGDNPQKIQELLSRKVAVTAVDEQGNSPAQEQTNQLMQAHDRANLKFADMLSEDGNCPHINFGGWDKCEDTQCRKMQPKDRDRGKRIFCWRKWAGCPTCNKGFGVQQQPRNSQTTTRNSDKNNHVVEICEKLIENYLTVYI